MDIGSYVNHSSDSFGDFSSSASSAAPSMEPADCGSSGEVKFRAPQDIQVELSGLKLVLASREYTLVERSNQLLRLMDELASKDHQLALTNWQVQLRDRRIAELEVKLADVHKGKM